MAICPYYSRRETTANGWVVYHFVPYVLLGLLLFMCDGARAATTCNIAQNVNSAGQVQSTSYWNPTCTDPLNPYCAQTNQGTRCNYCNPLKFFDEHAVCDCPANQFCDPDTSSLTYGTCVSFRLTNTPCTTYLDCEIYVSAPSSPGPVTFGYWSCVNNKCAPCNQTQSAYGNRTITCPGGSPYPLSSRQGETRFCATNGYWVPGGKISVGSSTTTPASTVATTTPGGSSSSAGLAQHRPSMSSLLLFSFLLPGVIWLGARGVARP